jgi:hypothetical protein
MKALAREMVPQLAKHDDDIFPNEASLFQFGSHRDHAADASSGERSAKFTVTWIKPVVKSHSKIQESRHIAYIGTGATARAGRYEMHFAEPRLIFPTSYSEKCMPISFRYSAQAYLKIWGPISLANAAIA